jgi:hypothetical protein
MIRQKKYLPAFWILCVVFFFRLLFLAIAWFNIRRFANSHTNTSIINIFSAYEITVLAIVFAEAMTYWFFRYRIINKLWVRLHVWLIFFAMLIIPLFMILFFIVAPNYLGNEDLANSKILLGNIRFYLSWGLIIISHFFFILTLVKFFSTKKEITTTEKSDNILEDFSR